MVNKKDFRDNQNKIPLDSKDKNQVEYLHRQYPNKTHQEIARAILAAGSIPSKITQYLQK